MIEPSKQVFTKTWLAVTLLVLTSCSTPSPEGETGNPKYPASITCGGGVAPKILEVSTDPSPAVAPHIRWTVKGNGFDPLAARAFFQGPGCPNACEVPQGAIDERAPNRISGVADLAVGAYKLTLKNGNSDPSNGVDISLSAPSPKGQ